MLLAFSRLDALQQLFMLVYAQARFADLGGRCLRCVKRHQGCLRFFLGGAIPKGFRNDLVVRKKVWMKVGEFEIDSRNRI